jgi:hypothetical protein
MISRLKLINKSFLLIRFLKKPYYPKGGIIRQKGNIIIRNT